MKSKVSISTNLDPEILVKIKELAAARGLSVSEFVRALIIADLERRRMIPPPKQLPERGT